MFDAYQHLINFDYKRVFSITRPWANSFPDFIWKKKKTAGIR